MAASLFEILDPEYSRKKQELRFKAEIEEAKLRQRDSHHFDTLDIEKEKIRTLREQNNIYSEKINGDFEIAKKRLELDVRQAEENNQNRLDIARIQAENNLKLSAQNHLQEMRLAGYKEHLSLSNNSYMLSINSTQSIINRGEEQSKRLSGAISNILEEKIKSKFQEKIEQKRIEKELEVERMRILGAIEIEKIRASENQKNREHEIYLRAVDGSNALTQLKTNKEFEILQSLINAEIHKANFTHDEILKLVIRLAEGSIKKDAIDELNERFNTWVDGVDL